MTDSATAAHAPEPSAEQDREGQDDQFVLPLVVRIERGTPPARTDALETAARAVLTLLADPRTTEETGAWHKRVRLWEERAIRKVVRRARGSEWRRVEALEHLTVTGGTGPTVTGDDTEPTAAGGTAEVRVFPPVPLDGWPKELSRLQVSGTDLTDPEPPPSPAPGTPVLWLNPDLEMTAGKAMAQAGHAAQLAWWELDAAARTAWQAAGFPLAVRPARDAAHWAELLAADGPVVRDAGFTEIPPGPTVTVEGVAGIAGLPPRP